MDHMQILKRIVLSLVVFVIVAIALEWLLGELAVVYEMWATGTKDRTELANDFGLGMIGILIVLPLAFIGALISVIFVWRISGKWFFNANCWHNK